jgi:hypothetical protein
MHNPISEFSGERRAIRIDWELRSADIFDVGSDLFILPGVPDHTGPHVQDHSTTDTALVKPGRAAQEHERSSRAWNRHESWFTPVTAKNLRLNKS